MRKPDSRTQLWMAGLGAGILLGLASPGLCEATRVIGILEPPGAFVLSPPILPPFPCEIAYRLVDDASSSRDEAPALSRSGCQCEVLAGGIALIFDARLFGPSSVQVALVALDGLPIERGRFESVDGAFDVRSLIWGEEGELLAIDAEFEAKLAGDRWLEGHVNWRAESDEIFEPQGSESGDEVFPGVVLATGVLEQVRPFTRVQTNSHLTPEPTRDPERARAEVAPDVDSLLRGLQGSEVRRHGRADSPAAGVPTEPESDEAAGLASAAAAAATGTAPGPRAERATEPDAARAVPQSSPQTPEHTQVSPRFVTPYGNGPQPPRRNVRRDATGPVTQQPVPSPTFAWQTGPREGTYDSAVVIGSSSSRFVPLSAPGTRALVEEPVHGLHRAPPQRTDAESSRPETGSAAGAELDPVVRGALSDLRAALRSLIEWLSSLVALTWRAAQ